MPSDKHIIVSNDFTKKRILVLIILVIFFVIIIHTQPNKIHLQKKRQYGIFFVTLHFILFSQKKYDKTQL